MARPLRRIVLIAVLPLVLMPGLAAARACLKPKETTAAICLPGAVWGETSASCVPLPAS